MLHGFDVDFGSVVLQNDLDLTRGVPALNRRENNVEGFKLGGLRG